MISSSKPESCDYTSLKYLFKWNLFQRNLIKITQTLSVLKKCNFNIFDINRSEKSFSLCPAFCGVQLTNIRLHHFKITRAPRVPARRWVLAQINGKRSSHSETDMTHSCILKVYFNDFHNFTPLLTVVADCHFNVSGGPQSLELANPIHRQPA